MITLRYGYNQPLRPPVDPSTAAKQQKAIFQLSARRDYAGAERLRQQYEADNYKRFLNQADPEMIALNRQATEDRADLELRAREEQAADARDAAARQNQLALAMATRRRAPGGGLVMGGGARRGGVAIGATGGGLSRANAEALKKARMSNLSTKHSARAEEMYATKMTYNNPYTGEAKFYAPSRLQTAAPLMPAKTV